MAYTGTTAAILSNYDEVLKTLYLPAIQEQLVNDNYLVQKIEVNEEDVSGKDATIECHYGRNTGTAARSDGQLLPDAGYQKYKTMTVPTKYIYGRVTFSGPTIAATRDDKGSYARVIDNEIAGVVRDLSREVNRMYWGCGYGILARWYSGSTSAMLVQKRYCNNAVEPSAFGSTFGGKYLTENGTAETIVPAFTSGLATAWTADTTGLAVTAVTSGTYTDTLANTDTGATEAAGTFFARPGNLRDEDDTSAATTAEKVGNRREIMGLRGIVTDTDLDDIAFNNGTASAAGFDASAVDALQGLTIGTYTWWKANVDSHASGRYQGQRALTLTLMQKMFDTVELEAGKDYGPDTIITTHAIRREYLELVQADRRYVNTMALDGGWTALDYNGVPLMVDRDAIDGEMYFLTMKDIQLYRMSDYDWMNKDGAVLSRITNYDAYEAVLFRYAELGCKRRNSQGVITDIAYDA